MKIKKIYISAFGGLKDFSMDFSDGFNTVFGENENGKSSRIAGISQRQYENIFGALRNKRRISITAIIMYAPVMLILRNVLKSCCIKSSMFIPPYAN